MRGALLTALLVLGMGGCGTYPQHLRTESDEHRAQCELACREHGAEAYAYMETRTHRICKCFRQAPPVTRPGRGDLIL